MQKRKTFIGGGIILALVVISGFIAATTRQDSVGTVAETARPTAVEITPATTGNLSETISAVGTIAAMRDVMVSSETAGRVTRVAVKVGDPVKQGQTLVQVDDELKAIAVEQARAQLQAAETNFNKTKKDFARAEMLFKAGDIADVELEGNRLALHSSEAQFKSAQVGLRFAERQYNDTRIKAPVAGIVASKKVEVGEMVGPGREIANIVDIANLKVKLSIPEDDIAKLRVTMPATLRVDTAPGVAFHGTVYSVGSKSESPTGHSYPVEVIVKNKDVNALKVGMFGRVEIHAGSAHGVVITKESLVGDDSSPAVFIADGNLARLRPIRIGMRTGSGIEVLEGLREGDRVISFGNKNLKDGSPIQFK